MTAQTISTVQQRTDGRWIVAVWNERNAQYTAPMTALEKRVTGAHTWSARTVDGLGDVGYIYRRRSDALRRARLVYDEATS